MSKKKIAKYAAIVLAGATLLAGALKSGDNYTSTPRYIVNHTLTQSSQKNPEKSILSEEKRVIEERETGRDLLEILAQFRIEESEIQKAELISSTDSAYMSPEKNHRLVRQITRLGKDSIDHLFDFIKSPYLEKKELHFSNPQTAKEVKTESQKELDIYIVNDLGTTSKNIYKIFLRNGEVILPSIKRDKPATGQTQMKFNATRKENGFELEERKYFSPLFYSTAPRKKVCKVEAIAIETLHDALRKYSYKNIEAEAKNIGRDDAKMNSLMLKWVNREETIVHAISIPWIEQYNLDKQLGISSGELTDRFRGYAQKDTYRYVLPMANLVKQIGPAKAVELYVTNPESLFREIEKK